MEPEIARQLLAAQGFAELGLYEEAGDELASLDPDLTEVKVLRCDLLARQSRWEEMQGLAEGLARTEPGQPQWWISWAYAARRTESLAAARRVLLESRRHHPDNAIIVYNLACYASVEGDHGAARELLDEATRLDPVCEKMAAKDEDLAPLFAAEAAAPAD